MTYRQWRFSRLKCHETPEFPPIGQSPVSMAFMVFTVQADYIIEGLLPGNRKLCGIGIFQPVQAGEIIPHQATVYRKSLFRPGGPGLVLAILP